MPTQEGIRLHDQQRLFPGAQLADQEDKQRPVAPGECRALCLPFEDDQLLAQRSVFEH